MVFVVVSDPVGAGLVANLARPGGNITGFLNVEASMGGKWVELLNEVAPGLRRAVSSRTPKYSRFSETETGERVPLHCAADLAVEYRQFSTMAQASSPANGSECRARSLQIRDG